MFDKLRFNAAIALKGETRADAAKVMGVHPATLLRKINGDSDFSRHEIAEFCQHYEVSPEDVFFANSSAFKQK